MMISTVHIKNAVVTAISKLSPDKIIFLIEHETKKSVDITDMKEMFSRGMTVDVLNTSAYDIVKIASDVIKKIEEENKAGNEIILHVTEGRKTLAFGAMYAAYARKSMVSGIYYITEETREIISLPVLEINLNESKKIILNEISKGNNNVKSIAKKAGVSQAMVYAHISSLKKEGYISEKDELTNAGKIVIL